jgi:hypothetical protein
MDDGTTPPAFLAVVVRGTTIDWSFGFFEQLVSYGL